MSGIKPVGSRIPFFFVFIYEDYFLRQVFYVHRSQQNRQNFQVELQVVDADDLVDPANERRDLNINTRNVTTTAAESPGD